MINVEIEPYDVFVGVMWKRLGTPTHRADSGTVEEFERAYALWEQAGVPLLMFYFSRIPFFPQPDELAQFQAVLSFKETLATRGGLCWEYESQEAFEAMLHEHLFQQVRTLVAVADSRRLNRSLSASGLGLVDLATASRSLDDGPAADEIRHLLSSLLERVERLDQASSKRGDTVPAAALLEAAHGLMAARKWSEAAYYFDRYVQVDATNWDAMFSRAVAHANSRSGTEGDTAALRSYNDAIALRPQDLDANLLARLYSYRGAMFKRLGRLEEAEADLRVARSWATRDYERDDIRYNLACVCAMTDRRAETFELVESLRGTRFIGAIRANLHRYFAAFAADPEFLALL
ncbi:hypothetical protein OM076_11100 [Solirubrobacter ginsenosidimutans]|uniref:Tetratricopeptide repeat protein n=1 Tax=Solirubrobacter ginsenosidimutans TaxID=490573 RepID=A0A9X3MR35_9ACTN|nr:hypothetical protein [Solirubrobacter ginsenosidimutans]MDA0160812.1 hypothetical protein [Solirubrobacter ginsenosidimutans]